MCKKPADLRKNRLAFSVISENHNQHHLKLLLTIDRMGMLGWHHNGFALMEHIFLAVNGDFANAIQTGDEGIAGRLMGADFLALVKGEQSHADCAVLCQRAAYHLTGLAPNTALCAPPPL